MKNIRLIIFDGGGTIWYSMPVLWEHYKSGFFFLGLISRIDEFPYTLETANELSSLEGYNSRWNISKALVAMFLMNINPEQVLNSSEPTKKIDSLIEKIRSNIRFKQKYEKLSSKLGFYLEESLCNYNEKFYPPCKDVVETIKELKRRGYLLAMSSNRRLSSVENILDALNIKDYFDKIEAPLHDEPEAKSIESLLRSLSVPRTDAVFVGDSVLDIKAGKKDGLRTIAVLSGMGTLRTLQMLQPDFIIEDISKIFGLLQ